MAAATTVLLVRHGRSPSNVVQALDSAPPGPGLDATGRAQAEKVAAELAATPVGAVYASRARRSQETAVAIAGAHGLSVQVLDGAHEVQVGDLEGSTDPEHWARLQGLLGEWMRGDRADRMPGGENGPEVAARFRAEISRIAAVSLGGRVVVVTHGGAMRLVTLALCPEVDGRFAAEHPIPNTGSIELRFEPGTGWTCARWADLGPPAHIGQTGHPSDPSPTEET
jgi:probable phosphoglycerate mutase